MWGLCLSWVSDMCQYMFPFDESASVSGLKAVMSSCMIHTALPSRLKASCFCLPITNAEKLETAFSASSVWRILENQPRSSELENLFTGILDCLNCTTKNLHCFNSYACQCCGFFIAKKLFNCCLCICVHFLQEFFSCGLYLDFFY